MADLFPEIVATVEPLPLPMPVQPDLWIVIAVMGERGAAWTVPSQLRARLFTSREIAVEHASKLPSCWRHARIVRIPGRRTRNEIDDFFGVAAMLMIEGEWSGYTSQQKRIVHREYLPKSRAEFAEKVRAMSCIIFTDGTCLDLTVREVSRKDLKPINGYPDLIRDCAYAGVSSVQALQCWRNDKG